MLALLLSGFSITGLVNPRLSPKLLPYLCSGYVLLGAAALALSLMGADHGLMARYYAQHAFTGAMQHSPDASAAVEKAGATRIDPVIRNNFV